MPRLKVRFLQEYLFIVTYCSFYVTTYAITTENVLFTF